MCSTLNIQVKGKTVLKTRVMGLFEHFLVNLPSENNMFKALSSYLTLRLSL